MIEEPGWQNRGLMTNGRYELFQPGGVIAHHTATGLHHLDFPSKNVCINGHSNLRGPLCHVLIGRETGTARVIAAGKANHAGSGGWRGLAGNKSVLGVEVENDGVGEVWKPHVLDAFNRTCAALLNGINADYTMLCGHKEWTPRKIDPAGIDMDAMRREVSKLLNRGGPPPPAPGGGAKVIVTHPTDTTERKWTIQELTAVNEWQQLLIDLGLLTTQPEPDGYPGRNTRAANAELRAYIGSMLGRLDEIKRLADKQTL